MRESYRTTYYFDPISDAIVVHTFVGALLHSYDGPAICIYRKGTLSTVAYYHYGQCFMTHIPGEEPNWQSERSYYQHKGLHHLTGVIGLLLGPRQDDPKPLQESAPYYSDLIQHSMSPCRESYLRISLDSPIRAPNMHNFPYSSTSLTLGENTYGTSLSRNVGGRRFISSGISIGEPGLRRSGSTYEDTRGDFSDPP